MAIPAIARWPQILISVDDMGSVRIAVAGVHRETIPPARNARKTAMDHAVHLAKRFARPLDVNASDVQGTFHMTVHPDGHVDEHGYTPFALEEEE